MIQITNLSKTYGQDSTAHTALRDINLTIEDGDIYGIIGQSGAGKSTLVRCLNLLEQPSSGSIKIDNKEITNLKGKELLAFRSSIGMIFQNFSLFQQRSVLKNVSFPLELLHKNSAEAQERARELLALVGLEHKADAYPCQLSGGQQQRVAIARALANNPSIMLCDEATSALDSRTTAQILDLLASINKQLGVTMIVITHSLAVAEKICNKVAVIDGGVIAESGYTTEVFNNPQSAITRELVGGQPQSYHQASSLDDSVEKLFASGSFAKLAGGVA